MTELCDSVMKPGALNMFMLIKACNMATTGTVDEGIMRLNAEVCVSATAFDVTRANRQPLSVSC